MFNGKRTAATIGTLAHDPNRARRNAVAFLLSVNTESYIQETYDQKSTVQDSSYEVCSGWHKIQATCVYEPKPNVKTKNKKVVGGFRNITTTVNTRNDRKKMKFLFSTNLKYMFTAEKHEYIPSNGVYRMLKFAESNMDYSVYKRNARKPAILPPLTFSDDLVKETMVIPEVSKSGGSRSDNNACSSSYLQLKKDLASFSISDLSRLRVDGDYPHTVIRRSLKKGLLSKSKSADGSLKAKDIENITNCLKQTCEADSIADLKKEPPSNGNLMIDGLSSEKLSQPKNLSAVPLKAMTHDQKPQDCSLQPINTFHRFSCLNIAQPFCNFGPQETFSVFKTKDQKAKKFNKGLLFHEICKTFNQDQTYSNYQFGLKSTLADTVQTTSGCLGQDFLPEILGKRIHMCPTIHRWL